VLRLKYLNFNHRAFADSVTRNPQLHRFRRKLLEIDLKLPETEQAVYLRDAYAKVGLPADLASQLGTLRDDVHVVLNGPEPAPFSPKACVLHRIAIWALVAANHLDYKPGKLNLMGVTQKNSATGLSYMVPIPSTSGSIRFDKVVIRHGPKGWLRELAAVDRGYRGVTDNPAKDRTRHQLYPPDFYPKRERTQPPEGRRTYSRVSPTVLPRTNFTERVDVPRVVVRENPEVAEANNRYGFKPQQHALA
jgi:hypothetical protein